VRTVVPERLRDKDGRRPERESAGIEARHATAAPARESAEDREKAQGKARTRALIRHARAVDANKGSPEPDTRTD
jgi:hypothetical protein